MNYLNLETNDMREPEFTLAPAQEKGAWLTMMLHAVATENGGVLAGSGLWTERQWIKACGLTFEEIGCDEVGNPITETTLWYWRGDDLYLWGFPQDKVDQVQAGRSGGKKGGRPKKNPPENPPENPPLKPSPEPERKGKEENGMEVEEEGRGARPIPAGAPASLEEALTWAAGYSKGNAEMLVINDAWVRDWFDERSSAGWERVSGGLQIPITDWKPDCLRWCRREAKFPKAIGSSPGFGPQKKEGGPPAVENLCPAGFEAACDALYGRQPGPWATLGDGDQVDIRAWLAAKKEGGAA